MGQKLSPRLQATIDKSEILDVLTAVARGLDRVDENLLRAVLHPDSTFDLGPGVFQGTGNDYIQWVMGVLQGVKTSHHMIGNVRTELEGDVALVESYFQGYHRIEKSTGREDVFLGGRNLDRMERRPSGPGGVWKLMHRKQLLDWVRTEAASDIFYHQNPDALWSYRTKTDASAPRWRYPLAARRAAGCPPSLAAAKESKSARFVRPSTMAKNERIGLYPGTFDPITLGHIDIIQRAAKVVDQLRNRRREKIPRKGPLFDTKSRVAMVMREVEALQRKGLKNISVMPFENLLMHFARDIKAAVIIRGLRARQAILNMKSRWPR